MERLETVLPMWPLMSSRRGSGVSSGSREQVNHLCHRPFCIQPAHLYLGDAQSNAEDRQARVAEVATYKTWAKIGEIATTKQ